PWVNGERVEPRVTVASQNVRRVPLRGEKVLRAVEFNPGVAAVDYTIRPVGGVVATSRSAWYRRVRTPDTVPDAKPPRPSVSIHSRSSRDTQAGYPNDFGRVATRHHSVSWPRSR